MTSVLVTGASGFIGAHALRALGEGGHRVHAVARGEAPARLDAEAVTWHRADLLDPAAAREVVQAAECEALLHLAWYAVPGRYWTAPENIAWVRASIGLVEEFAAAGGTRVVGAGTCAEYEWGGEVLSETSTPLRPGTLYGTAKAALGQLLTRWPDLSVGWGRVFFLYGPGEAPERLVPAVAGQLAAGERAAVSAGDQVRDFMHVADVAGALVALLDSGVEGAVNIGSGEGVAVREVIELVAAHYGRPELVGWGERPTPPDDPPAIVADAERLRGEVGFAPGYALADGIADAVTALGSGSA